MNTHVSAIIPARYESTRFPGKPLTSILDRPMIQWVVEGTLESESIDEVYVATDDERIYETVENISATPIMTSPEYESGSDRVAAVAADLDSEIIVNVQGDEPLITGSILDRGINAITDAPDASIVSYMAPLEPEKKADSDVVKVVVDSMNRALYFSRAPIPYARANNSQPYQHIGIYIFRKPALLRFTSTDSTPLEQTESLEQLRALEHGERIRMVELETATIGVDQPEDVEVAERRLRNR